jgi:hypothetical protein
MTQSLKSLIAQLTANQLITSKMFNNVIYHSSNTGKSTMASWMQWWNIVYGKDENKLIIQKNGEYKVFCSGIQEKLEWLIESFGMGSNNRKSAWRIKWIDTQEYLDGRRSHGTIWLKPHAAALYKLKWGDR